MPPAAVFLHLLLLTSVASAASPIIGLDSFLTQQFRRDPHAGNDSFLSLPSSLKTPLSHSSPAHPPVPESLLSLDLPVPISVHLVGPIFSSSAPSILSSFVSSTVTSDLFHVVAPSSDGGHHLSVSHSLHFSASLSQPSLSSALSSALTSHLTSSPSPLRSALSPVPYSVIDQIIRDEFEKEKPISSFHIYIIHLGSQPKSYAYSYSHGDSSPGHTKCFGSIWAGRDRYMWIDLGAGPVDYGPALSGDGVLPKGEFHPLATLHGRPKSEKVLLSDSASLLWSAYQALLVPSLRIPVQFENTLLVEFIHIHGGNGGSVGLDWKSIERTFMDEVDNHDLLLGNQHLSFKKYDVKLSECSICSFAIAVATTSYTSRYLFDNYTLIVSEYLDSKRLHHTILNSVDEFRRVVGKLPEEEFDRILPVYVFDLDVNTILLLDRFHQSVAFKDMVIAVRTRSTQTVSDYTCNGHHVFTQTRELERPLVGSILQSMWGVSPTHLVWSPRHNHSLVDYTWSVGHTPFGPFSETSSLSFVQKDASRRNVLLTSLNYSITSGVEVLDSIGSHGGERKLLKRHYRHTEFLQRWNLFRYKLDKTMSAMSHFDYDLALYYLRSSDHDLYAMHALVYRATQELEASLVCFKDPPLPWMPLASSGVVIFALLFAYAKRDKLFRNKRKQF